jgi:hypothetical protein
LAPSTQDHRPFVGQSHFPEQGTNVPLTPVTVTDEPVRLPDEAVTVIDPTLFMRTIA